MKTVHTIEGARAALSEPRRAGKGIALVPTMGALHAGHASLLERARATADLVVLSVFVNPMQFAPGEDLERYPRTLGADQALAARHGVDLVFAPSEEEMYPPGAPVITVEPGPLAARLCGAVRPGHFQGVLTVVAKLFNILAPDLALFGQKDFQQAVLIKAMTRSLAYPIEVDIAPTVRELNGLALSSRNAYLDAEERQDAVGLWLGLQAAEERFRSGERGAKVLLETLRETVARHPRLTLEYAHAVDPETLEFLERVVPGSVLAVAAHCGNTRLIDNHRLGSE